MRILVVEDEPLIRRLVAKALTAGGHDVTIAEGGLEAWEALSGGAASFDRVVADVRMPHMGGVELLRTMREHGIETPTVLMSGHLEGASAEWDALGSVIYLKKPFSLAKLRQVLDDMSDPETGPST